MRKFSITVLVIGVMIGAIVLSFSQKIAFASPSDQIKVGLDEISNTETSNDQSLTGSIQRVIKAGLFITGSLAILMIIFGGLKYVSSGGDASAVTSAKNTILYALVGLIVAVSAYALVDFVTSRLSTPAPITAPADPAPQPY